MSLKRLLKITQLKLAPIEGKNNFRDFFSQKFFGMIAGLASNKY